VFQQGLEENNKYQTRNLVLKTDPEGSSINIFSVVKTNHNRTRARNPVGLPAGWPILPAYLDLKFGVSRRRCVTLKYFLVNPINSGYHHKSSRICKMNRRITSEDRWLTGNTVS
jgi:hypothetical protein